MFCVFSGCLATYNQCTVVLTVQVTDTVHLFEHCLFCRDFTFLKHIEIDLAVYSWPREDLLFERYNNVFIKRGEIKEILTVTLPVHL